MSHQLLNRAHRQLLLVPQRLDHRTSLCQHVRLNHPRMAITGVPLSAQGHLHKRIELLTALVLGRQVLNHVLLHELLVSLLVQLDTA